MSVASAVLLFCLVLFLGGGLGFSRHGWVGMSPAGVVLLILLVLWLTGNLR